MTAHPNRSRRSDAPGRSIRENFDAHWLENERGCWIWQRAKDDKGYGRLNVGKRGITTSAHRFSWQRSRGTIPDGLGVLHKCDTPSCVNPAHLFLGSNADNIRDMYAKRRCWVYTQPEKLARGDRNGMNTHPESRLSGEKHPLAKLNATSVREIKHLDASGVPKAEIARRMGVARQRVSEIVHGKAWAHIK